jgi:hypothetical protein
VVDSVPGPVVESVPGKLNLFLVARNRVSATAPALNTRNFRDYAKRPPRKKFPSPSSRPAARLPTSPWPISSRPVRRPPPAAPILPADDCPVLIGSTSWCRRRDWQHRTLRPTSRLGHVGRHDMAWRGPAYPPDSRAALLTAASSAPHTGRPPLPSRCRRASATIFRGRWQTVT